MRRLELLAVLLCPAIAFSQGTAKKQFTVEGTQLYTSLPAFKAKHPKVTCDAQGAGFISCRLPFHTGAVGGLAPSRMNFNFENSRLTDITAFFYPAPSGEKLAAALKQLTTEYGTPKKETGYLNRVFYRWKAPKTEMNLIFPRGGNDEAMLTVSAPHEED
jgi:hypothetical protein